MSPRDVAAPLVAAAPFLAAGAPWRPVLRPFPHKTLCPLLECDTLMGDSSANVATITFQYFYIASMLPCTLQKPWFMVVGGFDQIFHSKAGLSNQRGPSFVLQA